MQHQFSNYYLMHKYMYMILAWFAVWKFWRLRVWIRCLHSLIAAVKYSYMQWLMQNNVLWTLVWVPAYQNFMWTKSILLLTKTAVYQNITTGRNQLAPVSIYSRRRQKQFFLVGVFIRNFQKLEIRLVSPEK